MTILKLGSKGSAVKELQALLNLKQDGVFGPLTKESVEQFQRENKLTVDGKVGPATMAKLLAQRTTLKKSKRTINEIIIHCSATPEGKDFTTEDIKRWHIERGFSDIGYHYVIYRDGSVNLGRDVNISGAHCTNHNSRSIGVCYIGGCEKDGKTPKDTRTAQQKTALVNLLKELRRMYPNAKIYGHRNFSSKACPSFDAKEEYKDI